MHRRRMTLGRLAATAGTLAAACAMAAYAANADSPGAASAPGQRTAGVGSGPERQVRAFGLAGAPGKHVFDLRNGEAATVVAGGEGRCLLFRAGGRAAGEVCAAAAAIDEGRGVNVTDECGAGAQLMEISGLVRAGTASVRVIYSDGSARAATLAGGAFKYDGTNPRAGEPYPTAIETVASDGAASAAGLPVTAGEFCPPPS